MNPFGLCDCHKSEIFKHVRSNKKIQAIKVLRDCTGVQLKDAKGVIDFAEEYHECVKLQYDDFLWKIYQFFTDDQKREVTEQVKTDICNILQASADNTIKKIFNREI